MSSEQRSVALSGQEDVVIADLIEVFTARLQAGEAIDAEAFCAEHPAYAERLRGLLPGVQVLGFSAQFADQDRLGTPKRSKTLRRKCSKFPMPKARHRIDRRPVLNPSTRPLLARSTK
jgi:hypothetical protein